MLVRKPPERQHGSQVTRGADYFRERRRSGRHPVIAQGRDHIEVIFGGEISKARHLHQAGVMHRVWSVPGGSGLAQPENVTMCPHVEAIRRMAGNEPVHAVRVRDADHQKAARTQPCRVTIRSLLGSRQVLQHKRRVDDVGAFPWKQADILDIAHDGSVEVSDGLDPGPKSLRVEINAGDPATAAVHPQRPASPAPRLDYLHRAAGGYRIAYDGIELLLDFAWRNQCKIGRQGESHRSEGDTR